MARLSITSGEFEHRTLDLHFGRNTFGRSPENHWQIQDPSVSANHCEVTVEMLGVRVKDYNSTNGTFVDGERVQEAVLTPRQRLRMGQVEFTVENTEVHVAIPQFEIAVPAPPVVLETGAMICPQHEEALATHQCTHCKTVMCRSCAHRLRRRGGKDLLLCPRCSHPVKPLGPEPKIRKSLMDLLHMTVKLPLLRRAKKPRARRAR